MIYTLGVKEVYDRYISEDPMPMKLGRRDDWNGKPYHGGSVWKTFEDAKTYLANTCESEKFNVYGVMADLDSETVPNESGRWNDLLVDAVLVKLDQATGLMPVSSSQ